LIMLRSAGNESAAKILRAKFAKHFGKPLANILPGDRPGERAAMFLAIIAGVQVMRQVVRMPGLIDAEPTVLSDRLRALFEVLVEKGGA